MAGISKAVLIAGVGFSIFAGTAAITSAVLHLQPGLLTALNFTSRSQTSDLVCKTIATDPNPPLNVRSSPVAADDNIVGKLRNGTQLMVVDENQGWLRIVKPLEGWVYQELTVTSCISKKAAQAKQTDATEEGERVLQEAQEFYQAGNLNAAIALAQTVPPSSAAYQPGQTAIRRWQQDWKTAEATFYTAQKAHREGRWQAVIQQVKTYPDNRYWRAKLAPLVQQAIQRQAGKGKGKG
jgi:hypothetical protein